MAGTKSRLFSFAAAFLMIVTAIIIGGIRGAGNLEYKMMNTINDFTDVRMEKAQDLILVMEKEGGGDAGFIDGVDMRYIDAVSDACNEINISETIQEKLDANDRLTDAVQELDEYIALFDISQKKEDLRKDSVRYLYDADNIDPNFESKLESYKRDVNSYPMKYFISELPKLSKLMYFA